MKKTKSTYFSRLLFRGLGLVLPLALTVALLLWLWRLLANEVLGRVETFLAWALSAAEVAPLSPTISFALSAVVTIAGLLLLGFWFSGFVGRRIYAFFERGLSRVPFFGAVYPYIKQVTEVFFGEKKQVEFQRVVAVPYPRKEVYSLAFLTGSSMAALNSATGKELVSVFIPSSPMPATGYTLFVPADEIIEISLTVEEAFRTVVSGGVLLPSHAAAKKES
jgi:uncharacterized membrane protein